jgi:hypothetical protein
MRCGFVFEKSAENGRMLHMNAQDAVQYDAAKRELERVYAEVDAIKAEFRDLVAKMAAQLLAEEGRA